MKKTITLSITAIFMISLMSFAFIKTNGITNQTGGHGEAGCMCHSNSLNTAVAISLTASGTLLSAGYIEGTSYTINVIVSETAKPLFGFDFEALNSANTSVGILTAGTDNKVSGTSPVNVVHTGVGNTGSGTHTFSFTWVAPSASIGNVTFYYSGMGANDNHVEDSGDHWNKGSTVVTPVTVGITEYKSNNLNLSVFPNHVKESANVSYVLKENSSVSAKLLNITGQVVTTFFENEEQTVGRQNKKLAMNSSIATGIYFVSININGTNNYERIVVE